MTMQYDAATRTAQANATITSFGSNAVLAIYSGTPPASADAALSGNTLLVSLPASTVFGTGSAGGIVGNTIITTNAVASGTATFFRILTSGGAAKAQGLVDDAIGPTIDLVLNDVAISTGLPVAINSVSIPMAGA